MPMRPLSVAFACVWITATACDGSSSEPEARPPLAPRDRAEPQVSRPSRDEVDECARSPRETWLEGAPARGTIALAIARGGTEGLLAVADRQGEVRLRAAHLGGALGPVQTIELGGADALFALEPLGVGYLLLARGSCAGAADCLLAQRLDARGARAGAPRFVRLPRSLRTARRAAAGDHLYVAWSAEGGHSGLEDFTIEGGELRVGRHPLDEQPASEELPTEVLGLAASADEWATVWRRGAPEDARSRVYLTSRNATAERTSAALEALHDVLVIDAIAFDGRDVVLVASFEFSRPHFFRLNPTSNDPLEARAIEAGRAPPSPFADRLRATLDVDGEGLWLRRTTAASDPRGEPLLLARRPVGSATVARTGRTFVVAWLDPERREVRARRLTCR